MKFVWMFIGTSNIDFSSFNISRDYVEELSVSPITISRHFKLIGKIKKIDKLILHEMNENNKRKRFEISSVLLLRN